MNDRRKNDRWRLSKDVSVADVVAFLVAAGAVVTAWMTVNDRLVIVEAHGKEATADGLRKDQDIKDLKAEFVGRLDRIEDKLDRVIERRK